MKRRWRAEMDFFLFYLGAQLIRPMGRFQHSLRFFSFAAKYFLEKKRKNPALVWAAPEVSIFIEQYCSWIHLEIYWKAAAASIARYQGGCSASRSYYGRLLLGNKQSNNRLFPFSRWRLYLVSALCTFLSGHGNPREFRAPPLLAEEFFTF